MHLFTRPTGTPAKAIASEEFLIVGGTGKTGRRVAARLEERGVSPRIASRSGATPVFWEDCKTWETALRGVTAVYAAYAPDLAVPGAAETIGAFADRAKASGVTRFILLSGRGEEEAQQAEQAAQQSGLEPTILRCSWFAQNFSESFLADAVRSGAVFLPAGDVPEPFVDADDIAEVAVAALADDRHKGQLYELTGPTMRTFAEAVAEIGQAAGRTIAYQQVTPAEFRAGWEAEGVPGDLIWLIDYLFNTVLDGRNASVADGVKRALGREPKDFSDFVRDAAATGVWAANAETEVSQ